MYMYISADVWGGAVLERLDVELPPEDDLQRLETAALETACHAGLFKSDQPMSF